MDEMVEIKVSLDEWYVWAPRETGRTRTLQVDKKVARRWRAALKAFERMTDEITDLVTAQQAVEMEREARAAGMWVDDDEG